MTFSVIIPCFNVEKTIVRALDSVIKQTFKNFEIVIIDDGSTDDTVKVINEYFLDKDILFQFITQDNKGPSIARNNAVKKTATSIINNPLKFIIFLKRLN